MVAAWELAFRGTICEYHKDVVIGGQVAKTPGEGTVSEK